MFLTLLKNAVARGWTPEDLIHVLGYAIEHLLQHFAPKVITAAPTASVRDAWLKVQHDPSPLQVDPHDILSFSVQLRSLPPLPDELYDPQQVGNALNAEEIQNLHQGLRTSEDPGFVLYYQHMLRQQDRMNELVVEDLEDTLPPPVSARVYFDERDFLDPGLSLAVLAFHNDCACISVADQKIAVLVGAPSDVKHVLSLHQGLKHRLDADDIEAVLSDASHYFFTLYANRTADIRQDIDRLRSRMFRASDVLCVLYPQLARSSFPPYA